MNEGDAHIRYLNRKDIDIDKWDRCIQQASNGLIYARSFYLDAMSRNWSALVMNDYEAVMPLTWNRKFGMSYLYQPYFTKTLGVFGNETGPMDISRFLHAIPDKFKYWDVDFNENNFISQDKTDLKLNQHSRINCFLSLHENYSKLYRQYGRLAKRMTKKGREHNLLIDRRADPSVIIRLYRKDYEDKHPSISDDIYQRLEKCATIAFKNNLAETYLAKSVTGEIFAYYLILKDDKNIYSLLGGSKKKGKKTGAFYLLTDAVICEHAGTKKIFRFEGSDIPGVSFFNCQFGSRKTAYQHIVVNKLPFPFRYFK